MLELRDGGCYPKAVVGVNMGLASVDCVIAILAFCQVFFVLIIGLCSSSDNSCFSLFYVCDDDFVATVRDVVFLKILHLNSISFWSWTRIDVYYALS